MAEVQDKCLSIHNTEDRQVKCFSYRADMAGRPDSISKKKKKQNKHSENNICLHIKLILPYIFQQKKQGK